VSPVAYTDYGLRGPNVPLKMETFSGTKTILWHAKLFILLLLNISFVVCQSGYFVQNCIYYCTRFIPLREVCYFYLKIHKTTFGGWALLDPLESFLQSPKHLAGLMGGQGEDMKEEREGGRLNSSIAKCCVRHCVFRLVVL